MPRVNGEIEHKDTVALSGSAEDLDLRLNTGEFAADQLIGGTNNRESVLPVWIVWNSFDKGGAGLALRS